MSYCRFLEADVYVFTSTEGIECCFCSLIPRHWIDEPDTLLGGYLEQDNPEDTETYHSNQEMVDHLRKHQEAGHYVPERVFDRLNDPEDVKENEKHWKQYGRTV